jgi:GNAT superfamily N-acetyltransferase
VIRPAEHRDAPAVADIYLAARRLALPSVRWAHGAAEVRVWIADILVPSGGVWVAERAGAIAGTMSVNGDWLDQLYIHPTHWRHGIGTALMRHAKTLSPQALRLWCFQCNAPARAFYETHGFQADRFTDGQDNEEHEPDILYIWHPSELA